LFEKNIFQLNFNCYRLQCRIHVSELGLEFSDLISKYHFDLEIFSYPLCSPNFGKEPSECRDLEVCDIKKR